jgi:hypothetical protein
MQALQIETELGKRKPLDVTLRKVVPEYADKRRRIGGRDTHMHDVNQPDYCSCGQLGDRSRFNSTYPRIW